MMYDPGAYRRSRADIRENVNLRCASVPFPAKPGAHSGNLCQGCLRPLRTERCNSRPWMTLGRCKMDAHISSEFPLAF